MKLERLSEPVPDPFMAAVRRRHPDVDLVLLPPDPTAGTEARSDRARPGLAAGRALAGRALAGELLERASATADRLWHRAADDPAVVLRARDDSLVAAAAVGAVAGRSRIVAESVDGVAVLSRLSAVLQEDGWRVERADGTPHRLSAVAPGQTLRATHAAGSGALMIEVLSEAVDLGPVVARRLLDGQR